MIEDQRLDLSALDPMRDPEHWERVMTATRRRVDAALSRREDPFAAIAGWSRPLLLAAAAAVAVLIPLELVLELREARVEQVERLVALSTAREGNGEPPSAAEFVRALAAGEAP